MMDVLLRLELILCYRDVSDKLMTSAAGLTHILVCRQGCNQAVIHFTHIYFYEGCFMPAKDLPHIFGIVCLEVSPWALLMFSFVPHTRSLEGDSLHQSLSNGMCFPDDRLLI